MTYILCDACVNWRNVGEAKEIIRQCSEAGADAVKFQAYRKGHPGPGHPRAEEIDAIVMTKEIAYYLAVECRHYGVEFLCTPMYPDAVGWLSPMVSKWKVRFADRENEAILHQVQKYRTDKGVLISVNTPRLDKLNKYLYCVPEYPPKRDPLDVDFFQYDGFSSHYPQWQIPANIAKIYNCEYLEVHVMLDEYSGEWIPIDSAVSLRISDLKKLVQVVK